MSLVVPSGAGTSRRGNGRDACFYSYVLGASAARAESMPRHAEGAAGVAPGQGGRRQSRVFLQILEKASLYMLCAMPFATTTRVKKAKTTCVHPTRRFPPH
eukprot:scaffold20135_cov202-Isochrysis_galbana.AAC.1